MSAGAGVTKFLGDFVVGDTSTSDLSQRHWHVYGRNIN
jgi:hypothetical protein